MLPGKTHLEMLRCDLIAEKTEEDVLYRKPKGKNSRKLSTSSKLCQKSERKEMKNVHWKQ